MHGCWSISTPPPTRGAGARSASQSSPNGWPRPAGPIVYVNQVGGQDELVFDGASLVMAADGELLGSARQFEEEVLLVDVEASARRSGTSGSRTATPRREAVFGQRRLPIGGTATPRALSSRPVLGPEEEVYEALVLGTRDYV